MFVNLKDVNKTEIKLEDIRELDESIIAGYMDLDEFEKCYQEFGFSELHIEQCKLSRENIRSEIDVFDKYSFGIITVIEPTAVDKEVDKIAFFIKSDMLLIVKIQDGNNSTYEIFKAAIEKYKQNVTLEKFIYAYLENLIYGDSRVLESIGKRITQLEEKMLVEHATEDINLEIFNFKKELLEFKDYYEQLIDIGEELQDNENDLFVEEDLRYFKLFTDKVSRLCNYTESLTEMTVHLREAYEATLDLNLNSIMKVFTVITAIFFPLTLIVGWYGMNFANMPELTWQYGYPVLILISCVIVLGSIIYFKKKKFL